MSNKMSKLISVLVITAGLMGFGCWMANAQETKDSLYQVSTINALLQGFYDGELTFGELKKHGDLGIGTFASLDGEMLALDGEFFRVRADGKAYPVEVQEKTPFAVVTFFQDDLSKKINNINSYAELQQQIDQLLSNKNIFYAVRIDGIFSYVKTRSVPKQFKPYPPLAEVTKNQPTFEFQNIKGTLVGFWCPEYVNGINVPAYHLHFITSDRKYGGHLLECNLQEGKLRIDASTDFHMVLPASSDFAKVDLGKDSGKDLGKVEK